MTELQRRPRRATSIEPRQAHIGRTRCGRLRAVAPPLLRRACLLAGLLTAVPAFAAQLIVLEDECRGKQLLLKGSIERGDADRFADALARLVLSPDLPAVQDPETLWTVKLDSPGGDPAEAMAIGRLLRKGLATTEVSYRYAKRADGIYDFQPADDTICLQGDGRLSGCFADIVKAECAGACLLTWLGGADRYAHEGNLGTHGLPVSGADAVAVERYLVEMGVDADTAAALRGPQSDGEHWLSWPQRSAIAGRAQVLQEPLAACPERLSQQESLDSVMHEDPAVRDRLMDRAEAHRACRLAILAQAQHALRPELQARGVAGPATGDLAVRTLP